jgi:hypothetical protein
MLKRGEGNSRMKDFLDIWLLSRQFPFRGETLSLAVRKTSERRDTPVRADTVCLTEAFAADHERQQAWQALLDVSGITGVPGRFTTALEGIASFAGPLLDAVASSRLFTDAWTPSGPWRPVE